MAETSIARDLGGHEDLLHAVYLPPHTCEDGATVGEPVVTALFREPTANGGSGYTIREYSMGRGGMFYRFPRRAGTGAEPSSGRSGTARPSRGCRRAFSGASESGEGRRRYERIRYKAPPPPHARERTQRRKIGRAPTTGWPATAC